MTTPTASTVPGTAAQAGASTEGVLALVGARLA